MKNVSYRKVKLSELRLEKAQTKDDYFLLINEEKFKISKRFWSSFNRRFNLNNIIYNYFTPEETIGRIIKARGDVELRLAIESNSKILGVTQANKSILEFDQCIDWLNNNGAKRTHYHNGVLEGVFERDENNKKFQIGGDEFRHQHNVRIPVDGIGTPNLFVSLYRLVCQNGMMGFNTAFATPVNVDKENPLSTLDRATNNFKNDEGYSKLEKKMEDSQKAALSVGEAKRIKSLLEKTSCGSFSLSEYLKMVNLPYYGTKDLDRLGKIANTLPCTDGIGLVSVYDVINFLTELSTHKANDAERNRINGLVGQILSQEFDLPEYIDGNSDYQDLFLDNMDMDEDFEGDY